MMDRRRFLTTVAGGTVVGLAGCNSGLLGPSERQLDARRAALQERYAAVVSMTTPENSFVPETVTPSAG